MARTRGRLEKLRLDGEYLSWRAVQSPTIQGAVAPIAARQPNAGPQEQERQAERNLLDFYQARSRDSKAAAGLRERAAETTLYDVAILVGFRAFAGFGKEDGGGCDGLVDRRHSRHKRWVDDNREVLNELRALPEENQAPSAIQDRVREERLRLNAQVSAPASFYWRIYMMEQLAYSAPSVNLPKDASADIRSTVNRVGKTSGELEKRMLDVSRAYVGHLRSRHSGDKLRPALWTSSMHLVIDRYAEIESDYRDC